MTQQQDARPTPHTDALDTLGSIIDSNEKRDAIHLAVIPVKASEPLQANEDVGIDADGTASNKPANRHLVGKVDPFLTETVLPGDWFWLVIYPREITSLRHVWTHPAFDNSEVEAALPQPNEAQLRETRALIDPVVQAAKQRMTQFAEDLDVGYDEMLERAGEYVRRGDYWNEGEKFDGEGLYGLFWDDYDILMETQTPEDDRGSFFTCSC